MIWESSPLNKPKYRQVYKYFYPYQFICYVHIYQISILKNKNPLFKETVNSIDEVSQA